MILQGESYEFWYCLPDSLFFPVCNPETSSRVTLATLGTVFQTGIVGCGLLVMGYWLWVVGYGLWVVGFVECKNETTINQQPTTINQQARCGLQK